MRKEAYMTRKKYAVLHPFVRRTYRSLPGQVFGIALAGLLLLSLAACSADSAGATPSVEPKSTATGTVVQATPTRGPASWTVLPVKLVAWAGKLASLARLDGDTGNATVGFERQ